MGKKNKSDISGFSADYRSLAAGNENPVKDDPAAKDDSTSETSLKPRQDHMDNDTEIDDFLPENENADDEDLLEKWDSDEEPAEKAPIKKRGKHGYGIFAGTIVLLLAFVGIGFIAFSIGNAVHSRLTDDSKLRDYDSFLTVVVAQDPKPFTSPDKADPDFVLNASIWKTMTDSNSSNYTDYDSAGRTIVPLGDVADACYELFGPNCKLQPKNPTEETFFTYDANAARFHVALYSLDSTYIPYTESAKKKGGSTVLRVGYVPPSDETRTQSSSVSSGTPKPTKYMEYVLKTNAKTGKQYIYSIAKSK